MSTITQIALGNGNFSILVAALQYVDANVPDSNLVNTLNDASADFTVFAPTNAAFGQLAADLGFTGDTSDAGAVTTFIVDNLPATTIRDVLIYHVSAGGQTLDQLNSAGSITTLLGSTITSDGPTLVDAEPDLIDPSIVIPDISADNGVVHAIDRVLLPIDLPDNDAPTIAEIVAASGGEFDDNGGDFDLLLRAAQTANLVEALNDPDADLTAFAPNDDAFVGLSQALGYQGDDEEGAWGYLVEALTLLGGGDPVPLLTQVLLYHVAGDSLQASQVLSTDQIETLQGGSLGVDGTQLVDADPDVGNPNLIATDIQAGNGIVHVIDGVLLPVDVLASNGADDVDFIIANNRSNFIRTGEDNDYIDGNGGRDLISAGSGNDVALGGIGGDRMYGGSGNDLLSGDNGRDKVFGGSGEDVVNGGGGKDRLFGGRDDDEINGGAQRDLIFGGSGDDTIEGGTGNDIMYGGWGDDTFVFNEGDGHDAIVYFNSHGDKIDLSSYGFEGIEDIHISGNWFKTKIDLGDDELTLFATNAYTISETDFIF